MGINRNVGKTLSPKRTIRNIFTVPVHIRVSVLQSDLNSGWFQKPYGMDYDALIWTADEQGCYYLRSRILTLYRCCYHYLHNLFVKTFLSDCVIVCRVVHIRDSVIGGVNKAVRVRFRILLILISFHLFQISYTMLRT